MQGTMDEGLHVYPPSRDFFNRCGLIPRSLLRNGNSWSCQSPSFPRVFSGNPGETLTGPPIETFGGDDFRGISSWFVDTRSLLRGSSLIGNSFHVPAPRAQELALRPGSSPTRSCD